jgi:hypothetical protein
MRMAALAVEASLRKTSGICAAHGTPLPVVGGIYPSGGQVRFNE